MFELDEKKSIIIIIVSIIIMIIIIILSLYFFRNYKEKFNTIDHPTSSEVNLINYDQLKSISRKYDEIYHLAAWTQAGDFCLKNQGMQWIINQQINTNIVKWWQENQAKAKFIFI